MSAVLLLALAAAPLSGCSGPSGPADGPDAGPACPPGPTVGDLPCDVAAVLMARCQTCHRQPPLNHAPWPLLTYEDTQQPFGMTGLRRWQRMAAVIEPDNFPHMPPAGQPQLTDTDFQVLRGWFTACAPPQPEGTGCDVP